MRMAAQTGDVHAAGLEVDDEPDDVADEAAEREDLDGEEVGRRDRAEVRLEERLPWHRLAALGAGSKPRSARMRLIVFRPSSWPRLQSAPRIRV